MSTENRIDLIKRIEKVRGSKVMTYVVGDRTNIPAQMQEDDIRELFEHIRQVDNPETKIDLFIYSLGGAGQLSWALSNLIREYTNEFNVLIPFKAFSCATALSTGANKIIMHKAGILGPVDPLVTNPFNPTTAGMLTPISVEDVGGYLSLIRDKFDIKDQDNVTRGFEKLASVVHPLALGNVYRHYLKSRDDIKKLLELHLDPQKENARIEKIIDILVEKLYYHGHHINRKEAKKIGLDVEFAETISKGSDNLANLMWALFEEYEKDLDLMTPYADKLPLKGNVREIPIKFVESSTLSCREIIEQTFVDLKFPSESRLIVTDKRQSVYVPGKNGQQPLTIPLVSEGRLVILNDKIYEKIEIDYWKRETIKK